MLDADASPSAALQRPNHRRPGYDNLHAVKPSKKFKLAGQRLAYDHRHRSASDKGVSCAFESAQRLLEDFFTEVDRVIKEAQQ